MVVSLCSKSFKLGFTSMWTKNQYVQVGFRKGRGSRDQIAKIHWIIEKARGFQKSIYFCFMDCAKAFDCVKKKKKLWKISKEKGIPDHLTYFLRNLYEVHEATMRTRHGKTDCFQIMKGVWQHCILPPCLFNLCAEYRRTGFPWWFSE